MRLAVAALVSGVVLTGRAFAHGVDRAGAYGEWHVEPWVLAGLVLAAAWYAAGLLRMRRRAGLQRAVGAREVAAFGAGMLVLAAALLPPLDAIGEDLFSVHMCQHLLLMLVAAPLLVLGRPALPFVWAFPAAPRKRTGWIWAGAGLGRIARGLMHPVAVWLLFCGAFAFWHLPGPYQWAIRHEAVHALEHLAFLVSALMFWTIVIEPSGRRRIGFGATLLFVATTAVASGLPGALIFLAPRPLYPVHAAGVAAWGMTLMEDQQLAGVVMWIPAGMIYLAAVQWVFARWLAEADGRAAQPRAAHRPPVALVAAALALGTAGTAEAQLAPAAQPPNFGGDPDRGAALITQYGCGVCHIVPGIAGADGLVGPPLLLLGRRIYLAGVLRNTPDNLMTWLREPQRVVPGNAMPDMGIGPRDARDIAAYLYTLR